MGFIKSVRNPKEAALHFSKKERQMSLYYELLIEAGRLCNDMKIRYLDWTLQYNRNLVHVIEPEVARSLVSISLVYLACEQPFQDWMLKTLCQELERGLHRIINYDSWKKIFRKFPHFEGFASMFQRLKEINQLLSPQWLF